MPIPFIERREVYTDKKICQHTGVPSCYLIDVVVNFTSLQQKEDSMSQEDYREQAAIERALRAHPDCRDPEHPGCEICEPTEDKE